MLTATWTGRKSAQALFSRLIGEGGYVCRMFGEGHALPVRLVYRAMFPVAKLKIGKAYRLDDPQAVEQAFERTRAGLDFVAKEAGPDGHLVGNRFSVADLAAAALLAPCTNPPGCAMTRPEPQPRAVLEWQAEWEGHPGVEWVLRMYREHRSGSMALPS